MKTLFAISLVLFMCCLGYLIACNLQAIVGVLVGNWLQIGVIVFGLAAILTGSCCYADKRSNEFRDGIRVT